MTAGLAVYLWMRPAARSRDLPGSTTEGSAKVAFSTLEEPARRSGTPQPAPPEEPVADNSDRTNLKIAEQINASRFGMLADLDEVYAPFYRRLAFTPEKFKELRHIMAERQSLPFVVNASLQMQGISDPVLSEQILNEQRWNLDEKLRVLLTPKEYDAFVDFDRHSLLYKRTGEMAQRLDYLRVPITIEQEDSIVGIIKEISPEPITAPMHNPTKADWADYRRRREIEDQAILQRGRKVLNAEQLRALAELFEEKLAPVIALEQSAPAS